MAKQRKTRKEKMRQNRRVINPSETPPPTPTDTKIFSFDSQQSATPKPQISSPAEYSYLKHDLLKTTLLTVSIFVVVILLSLVIKI